MMTEILGVLVLVSIVFLAIAGIYKSIKTVVEHRRRKREKAERDNARNEEE